MPFPGGSADKIGNRYEHRWTIQCMTQVMAGQAQSFWMEPIGSEGDGVEFWIRFQDRLEYHQVKRQISGRGHWTIRALREKGVLETARQNSSNLMPDSYLSQPRERES